MDTHSHNRRWYLIYYINLVSLILGLVAWLLPLICLMRGINRLGKYHHMVSTLSMTTCASALFLQMIYTQHLVRIRDWSALMDITDAVVFASAVLIGITVILNIVLVYISHKVRRRND